MSTPALTLDPMAVTSVVDEALRADGPCPLLDDPDRATALLHAGRELARRAFDQDDPAAADPAHRVLYALGAQAGWSPVDAPREREHDLTLLELRLVLERAFEAQLARVAPLPEDPPTTPQALRPWLVELALERDLFPGPSMGAYYREHATLDQLREVVAQRSLFFLKEPDPWSQVIPTLRGPAKAGLLDLLLDEYGWGRHDQMHSTVYARMMERLGLETTYDHYLPRTAWPFLAGLNYQAMIGRHRRLCRRMYGYVLLVEADSPGSMRNYLAAYARAGVTDPEILRFYELHVDADEGHADVALNEIVLPVVRDEPAAAPEIARGVVEGRYLHGLVSAHLHACFTAGRSSLVGEDA